jgi:hypothetical protein
MRALAPVLLLVVACAPSVSRVSSSGDPAAVAGSRRYGSAAEFREQRKAYLLY